MIKQIITIANPTGLHARPAGLLCEKARQYDCNITLRREDSDKALNAKSVIHILTGKFAYGTRAELCCNGPGEREAMDALINTLENLSN